MYDGLLQALGFAGNVLDTPGSVARGLGSAGVRGVRRLLGDEEQGEVATRDLGRAFSGIGDPSQRVYGEEWTGDPWSGMAADIATDPTNIFGGIGLLKGMKAAKLAKVSNAKRAELLTSGGMPEEIAKLTKVVDDSGKPLRTYHGTGDVFDKYDMAKKNTHSLYGKGVYTTADPEVASTYVKKSYPSGTRYEPVADSEEIAKAMSSHYGEPLAMRDTDGWMQEAKYLLNDSGDPVPEAIRGMFENRTVPQNVRMQYVDARNPLNLDLPVHDPSLRALRKNLGMYEDISPPVKHDPIADAVMRFATPDMDTIGGSIRDDVGRIDIQKAIKDAGYDAMTHKGGVLTRGKPHQVVIALDPSQIYSPWIAPAAQRVPRQSPLLAAMLGYNTAARGGRVREQ